MTTIYLATPENQQQAEQARDLPVMVTKSGWADWMDRYQAAFGRLLIAPGRIPGWEPYYDWASRWASHADAIAAPWSTSGSWRATMRALEVFPIGFPTVTDLDPKDFVAEMIDEAQSRRGWLGVHVTPPYDQKESFVRRIVDTVPGSVHLHIWQPGRYAVERRFDSMDVDPTVWRVAEQIGRMLPWVTPGEATALSLKRYSRMRRVVGVPGDEIPDQQLTIEGSGR